MDEEETRKQTFTKSLILFNIHVPISREGTVAFFIIETLLPVIEIF